MSLYFFILAIVAFVMLVIISDKFTGTKRVAQYLKLAKDKLQLINKELEHLLTQKTHQLEKTNKVLEAEIIERKLIEKKLLDRNTQLQQLSARIQLVKEEESIRIAREIHDVLGQQLTVIKFELAWMARQLEKTNDPLTAKTKSLLLTIDDTIQSVKKISHDLRPSMLDDLGLIAAIEWQCREFEKRLQIKFVFSTRMEEENFGSEISTVVFRIFQEAVTNIIRHAQATIVNVNMFKDENQLFLEITDNGKGITESEINNNNSLGLLGMKERSNTVHGKLTVSGSPGKGTTLKLQVPLNLKNVA